VFQRTIIKIEDAKEEEKVMKSAEKEQF